MSEQKPSAPASSQGDGVEAGLRGRFIGPGATCPQFRLDSGEQISLTGDVSALVPERAYVLSGRWARYSKCMQGRELRVIEVEAE